MRHPKSREYNQTNDYLIGLKHLLFRQSIDKKIAEKCEDYEVGKKTQKRLIESLQASLEAETRSKGEVLRTKKKLEGDIQELESALDHISRVIGLQ